MPLSPPEPLSDEHQFDGFDSDEPISGDWLRRRARGNQASGASRTYVVCEGKMVVAYYALAPGAIAQVAVPGRFRRNPSQAKACATILPNPTARNVETPQGRFRRKMPDPIPVVVLGRLAVDRRYQGQGVGRALFQDAARRVAQAADTIGIRGIVVHAISEEARRFYIALGLDSCPADAMTLVVTLRDYFARPV